MLEQEGEMRFGPLPKSSRAIKRLGQGKGWDALLMASHSTDAT